jgi:hypothetical protein
MLCSTLRSGRPQQELYGRSVDHPVVHRLLGS